MDKYQSALIELARCTKKVKEYDVIISKALADSYSAALQELPKDWIGFTIFPDGWDDAWHKENPHLAKAYHRTREHYGHGMYDDYFTNHDDDVRGYLQEHCMHALRAHDNIEARKQARKELGIAKRRVTFLANRLLENHTQPA